VGVNKKTGCYLKTILFLGLAMQAMAATADSIVGSKHDLSAGAGGYNDEICAFCHTPHGANGDLDNTCNDDDPECENDDFDHPTRPPAPLWNRRITDETAFSMYTSDTLNSNCDATPSPLSLVCLSCHDSATKSDMGLGDRGAVYPDGVRQDMHDAVNEPNRKRLNACGTACHPYNLALEFAEFWEVGPDLVNDHPISMTYPTPAQDPDFFIPPDSQKGWSDVKLYKGRVECPSCHNPHDPANVPFLRKSMENSGLCTTCHNK